VWCLTIVPRPFQMIRCLSIEWAHQVSGVLYFLSLGQLHLFRLINIMNLPGLRSSALCSLGRVFGDVLFGSVQDFRISYLLVSKCTGLLNFLSSDDVFTLSWDSEVPIWQVTSEIFHEFRISEVYKIIELPIFLFRSCTGLSNFLSSYFLFSFSLHVLDIKKSAVAPVLLLLSNWWKSAVLQVIHKLVFNVLLAQLTERPNTLNVWRVSDYIRSVQ
jgi:hypothetical protein